jgi:uncharacterized phage protein gp47/JayE
MPFKVQSLSELRDFVVAVGKSLFPKAAFGSRRSWHGRRATYLAAAVTSVHAHVDSAQRDVHPLTAGEGKPINDWGEATGVERKKATPARKSNAGRIRGNVGATVTLGAQLKDANTGLLYQVNENVTIPASGFFDADILAIDVGAQTRLEAGTVLGFVVSLGTIEDNVVLQIPLDEDGLDEEQFGSYRKRILSTFSETPSGGSQADFVKWTLASVAAITSAYVYPNRAGKGTVDIAAFYSGTGTARTISAGDAAAIVSYIKTQTTTPFQITGTGGGLRILTTISDPRPVEITLVPNGVEAFNFDWVDPVSAPTVLSYNSTTRELQFSGGALPLSLRAGHHIVLRGVASAQTGAEIKIESISGVDKVILEAASVPAVAPAATDVIYSGGPLVTPVRDAIVAHLNGETIYAGRGLTPVPESKTSENGVSIIGLDILAEGIGSANPGGIYGAWSGAIIRSVLAKIATYAAGVRNATVVTPGSDYEAVDDSFPLDAQIHYVSAGAVLVRKA